MATSLMERRTVFMRVGEDRLGKDSVRLDKDTIARYNWEGGPTYFDAIMKHARQNNGKVLIPFNSIASARNIKLCTYFVMWRKLPDGDEYISGSIYDAGKGYLRGMDDGDKYTAPPEFLAPKATRWVKLFNLKRGRNFPFDDYMKDTYKSSDVEVVSMPLMECLENSKMSVIFAMRKED